jgi:hypothetical protein
VSNDLDQINLKTGNLAVLASNVSGAHGLLFVPSGSDVNPGGSISHQTNIT